MSTEGDKEATPFEPQATDPPAVAAGFAPAVLAAPATTKVERGTEEVATIASKSSPTLPPRLSKPIAIDIENSSDDDDDGDDDAWIDTLG